MGIFYKTGDAKRMKEDSIRNLMWRVLYIMKELLINILCMFLGLFVAAFIMRLLYC